MKLNKDSTLVKFAYWPKERYEIPYRTTLCAFFWRTFVFQPGWMLILLALVGVALFFIGRGIYRNQMMFLFITLGALTGLGIAYLGLKASPPIARSCERGFDRIDRVIDRASASVFWQGLKALKGKMCPLIELVGDEKDVSRWD